MPLVKIIQSSHDKLEKNLIYRLIIRSNSFSFRQLNSDNQLDTTLSLALKPEHLKTVSIVEYKKAYFISFDFNINDHTFNILIESIDLPVSVLNEKIQQIIDPNYEVNLENTTDLSQTEDADNTISIAEFLDEIELFVKSSYNKLVQGVKKSFLFFQNTINSSINQLKKISNLNGDNNLQSKKLTYSKIIFKEKQLLINNLITNYVDSKSGMLDTTSELGENHKDSDNKKVILFLHPLLFNWNIWRPYMQAFASDFRIIAYDLRGHGSSEVHKKDYKIKNYMEDLLEFLNVLEIYHPPTELTIITHSLTGLFLLHELEKRNIPSLSNLILLSVGDRIKSDLQRLIKKIPPIMLWEPLVKAGKGKTKQFLFSEGVKEEKKEELFDLALQTKKHVIAHSLKNFTDKKYIKGLKKPSDLNLPILFIVGDKDVIFPTETFNSLKLLPEAKIKTISNKNHLFPFEFPEIVIFEIRSFLSS